MERAVHGRTYLSGDHAFAIITWGIYFLLISTIIYFLNSVANLVS